MREVVDTEREFEQAITDYQTAGWETVDRGDKRAVLERGLRGSWAWHLLFLLFTPVVGNMAYSGYRNYNRPERLIVRQRADDAEGTPD